MDFRRNLHLSFDLEKGSGGENEKKEKTKFDIKWEGGIVIISVGYTAANIPESEFRKVLECINGEFK